MSIRPLVAFCALALALVDSDAGACSCIEGPPVVATPAATGAPLNTRVRVEAATYSGNAPEIELRTVSGDVVPTTARAIVTRTLAAVELTPKASLAPHTRYTTAWVDRERHPPVLVFGSFETGDNADTTAPRIVRTGAPHAHSPSGIVAKGTVLVRTSCDSNEPRIVLDGIEALDRPGARLAFAVWRGDASGRVDDTKPPLATLLPYEHALTIGRHGICDRHTFSLPEKGIVVLGLAAVDEAGNRSATQTIRVDMSAATP